ncbi:hypothetical protein GF371_00565 [Candidatus Woesearchaeota archaeon]|nr:hypothetical protein [Candidatus Woesearchaeota archaeon]
MENNLWESFQSVNNDEQKRIELTSAITNRMLRFGLPETTFFQSYEREAELLDMLYRGMADDETLTRGFEAFRKFVPKVPSEIFDRYRAIRHELRKLDLDTLIIGACGLSPLGLIMAEENPELNVIDTDLSDVVEYRRSLGIQSPRGYNLTTLNLLDPAQEDASNIPKGEKVAMVVEGLVFYLDEGQRKQLNNGLRRIAEQVTMPSAKDVHYIFDVYVADEPSRQRDTVVDSEHPQWKDFMKLVSNVYEGQKAFFRSREDVISYLESSGYENANASQQSSRDSAHTIFACKYHISGKRLYNVLANRIAAVNAGLITTKKSRSAKNRK